MGLNSMAVQMKKIVMMGRAFQARGLKLIGKSDDEHAVEAIDLEVTSNALFFFFLLLFCEIVYSTLFSMPFYVTKLPFLLAYSTLLGLIVSFVKYKFARRLLILLMSVFITALYFGESMYFSVFKTFAFWAQVDRLDELNNMGSQVGTYVRHEFFLFLIPVGCFLVAQIGLVLQHLFGRGQQEANKPKQRLSWKQKLIGILGTIALLATLGVYHGHVKDDINKLYLKNSIEYVSKYSFFDAFIVNSLQATTPLFKEAEPTGESVESAFRIEREENSYTDMYKDKNLIFIEGESIASYAIDPVLTPTLYRLQQEGYAFDNYYAPVGLTIESEYALMNSFYLTPEKEQARHNAKNSLPGLFRQRGYSTQAFHNFFGDFYRRDEKMPALGFDAFYDLAALEMSHEAGWDDMPSDIQLFERSLQHIPTDEKFLAYYITMTSHGKYDINTRTSIYENLEIVNERFPHYPDSVKVYLASVMVTDAGIARLYDELEHAGQLDDTVIVFVGDHYPKLLETEDLQQAFDIEQEINLHMPPFFIWDSSRPGLAKHELMSNVDVLPTLANMFGLDLQYAMGQDMFGAHTQDVFVEWFDTRGYSFLTPGGGYDGLTREVIGSLTSTELEALRQRTYRRQAMNNSMYLRDVLRDERP